MGSRNIQKTTVSYRFQTVVPARIRESYNIKQGTRIAWVDQGGKIELIPLPDEPRKQFRGAGRGQGLLDALLSYRTEERKKS